MFDNVLRKLLHIPGWLTPAQAELLYETAKTIPSCGQIVEIGSHQGKSTIALASGNTNTKVFAIDPFIAGGKFGGKSTEELFHQNVIAAGLTNQVKNLVYTSNQAFKTWETDLDLVFIDGKHDVVSTWLDLRWSKFLSPGSNLLIHDCFSSIGVTLAIFSWVLINPNLEYLGREGSLAAFQQKPTSRIQLKMCQELPWWCRNIALKIILRLKLIKIAERFGHYDFADPY